ncbi:unnamed protein product [Coccothraustes coccothraustes]
MRRAESEERRDGAGAAQGRRARCWAAVWGGLRGGTRASAAWSCRSCGPALAAHRPTWGHLIPLLRRRTVAPPSRPRLMIDATGPVHRPARPPLLGDRAGFPRYSGHTLPPLPTGRPGCSRHPRASPARSEEWRGQPHSGMTKEGGHTWPCRRIL